jgi:hypothetical protein
MGTEDLVERLRWPGTERQTSVDKKTNYAGMTVNERLFASGQLNRFEKVARQRDRAAMIEIYKSIDVEDSEWCVDTILANPTKYGF